MGHTLRSILSIAAPIAGTLLFPGIGTALGLGADGAGIGAAGLGAIGGGLGGAAGGALQGGGLGSILKGTALGAGGGYLGSGGASDLFGGTALGNTLGLSNPEGGSTFGNLLGSNASAPNTIGSELGLTGNGSLFGNTFGGAGNAGSNFVNAAGDSVAAGTPGATALNAAGAGSLAKTGGDAASGLTAGLATPGAATLSAGGAGSSFGPLSIGGALLGGYNSLSANDKAQKDLLAAEANAQRAIAPFQASGVAANSKLSDLLGTGTNTGASDFGSLAKPFNPSDLQNDPGYQFQLDQGNQALARQQAAAGNLDSGAAMKAAQEFGQGLAGTTYNNAFQRDQATKAQQYGMFSGQAGAGQNAANTSGQISQNIGNAKANNQIASSGILNQTLSSLLGGSGARTIRGYNPQTGQPIYA